MNCPWKKCRWKWLSASLFLNYTFPVSVHWGYEMGTVNTLKFGMSPIIIPREGYIGFTPSVRLRHRENFWAFTGPKRDFGLILLILNMIIHRSFTGPTHLLSANVRGPVSFAVSAVCPSVPLSRIPCPLCSAYSSGWIHFIFIHLIKQLQKC